MRNFCYISLLLPMCVLKMSLERPAIAPRLGDRFFQAGLKLLQMLVEIGVKRFEEVNCEHYTLIVPFVARVQNHADSGP